MRKLMVIAMLSFYMICLNGCSTSDGLDSDDIWIKLNDTEFFADDGWAGSGIFFYEENNEKYCLFMLYGSGVRITGYEINKIEVHDDNTISIVALESNALILYYIDDATDFTFRYEVDGIQLGDLYYEVSPIQNHEYVFEELYESD